MPKMISRSSGVPRPKTPAIGRARRLFMITKRIPEEGRVKV
jgi:hypothetical protein